MKELSSVDIYFLVKELNYIKNSRIDNFYFTDDIFYIKIYIQSIGRKFLKYKLGSFIYLDDEKQQSTFPDSFIQYLRKHFNNSYIRDISVIQSERIIKITIDKKQGEEILQYYLFLEVFSKGNIVLTNSDNKIVNLLKTKKYKDRHLMHKNEYKLPPKKDLSIFDLNKEKFIEYFKESDLSIIKFLAIKLGLGGKYSQEICYLAGINKDLTVLNDEGFSKLCKILNSFFSYELNPIGYFFCDKLVEFTPFFFNTIKSYDCKKDFSSYNELIKSYYKQFEIQSDFKQEEYNNYINKLRKRLEKQEEQYKQVNNNYVEFNNIGNKIYENYELIDNLLNDINKILKDKSEQDVKNFLNNDKILKNIVKKIDFKSREIIVDL